MSKRGPDIGIRLRPQDMKLKEALEKKAAELGMSVNAYVILVLKEHLRSKRKLGI